MQALSEAQLWQKCFPTKNGGRKSANQHHSPLLPVGSLKYFWPLEPGEHGDDNSENFSTLSCILHFAELFLSLHVILHKAYPKISKSSSAVGYVNTVKKSVPSHVES